MQPELCHCPGAVQRVSQPVHPSWLLSVLLQGKYYMKYDDGDEGWHDFDTEPWWLLPEPQQAPQQAEQPRGQQQQQELGLQGAQGSPSSIEDDDIVIVSITPAPCRVPAGCSATAIAGNVPAAAAAAAAPEAGEASGAVSPATPGSTGPAAPRLPQAAVASGLLAIKQEPPSPGNSDPLEPGSPSYSLPQLATPLTARQAAHLKQQQLQMPVAAAAGAAFIQQASLAAGSCAVPSTPGGAGAKLAAAGPAAPAPSLMALIRELPHCQAALEAGITEELVGQVAGVYRFQMSEAERAEVEADLGSWLARGKYRAALGFMQAMVGTAPGLAVA